MPSAVETPVLAAETTVGGNSDVDYLALTRYPVRVREINERPFGKISL
jgi:hypothetical protein